MSILIAQRRFAPTLFTTVLTIAAVALFVRLGFWQLGRAAEKQALQEQYQAGQQLVVDLTAANARSLARYQHLRATGHYDPSRQILLDNMPSAMGQPGYRVVTPFELQQGGWILVDRGWHPAGRTRADIPDVSVGDGARAISGELDRLPQPGVRLGAGPAGGAWPRVMSFPEQTTVEQVLERPLLPGLILLDPEQPDGYERAWQARRDFSPDRHLSYAVQWFAFAVAAVVIYVVVGLKRGQDADERAAS